MSVAEERREDVELHFTRILLSPAQYVDTQFCTLSVCVFYIFWGYIIVIIFSGFYHCHRVLSKVQENKRAEAEVKMEEMNHHEYGIDSSIWCLSPSSVSRAQLIQMTDLTGREKTIQ